VSLWRFFRRQYWDEERAHELDAYLAQEIDDNIARGMTREQARAAAHRQLGNTTRIREEIYEFNSMGWIERLRLDLRDGWKQVRRRRQASVMTVFLLAVGVGGSSAAFCVVDAVLVRPLPYPDASRLAVLWETLHGRPEQLSYPDYRDLRTLPQFAASASILSGPQTIVAAADVDRVTVIESDSSLLSMLGARPAAGRIVASGDAGRPVAVISHRLWTRLFHSDAGVIGKSLQMDGRAVTIVGVLAADPDFELPIGSGAIDVVFTIKDIDVWMPLDPSNPLASSRSITTFESLVRLRPGETIAGAQAALDAAARGLAGRFPATNAERGFRLIPLRDQVVGPRRTAIWLGFAAAVLLLIVACVNAAGLTIGELPLRRRDLALRASLGATRGRLLRQALAETALVAAAAGAAAIPLASAMVGRFVSSVDLPRGTAIHFDLRIALFAFAVAVIAALAARLVPMLGLLAGADGLRAVVSTQSATAPRLRQALVSGELTIAVLVSATALLLGGSLRAILRVDPGFVPSHVLSARVSVFGPAYRTRADVSRFFANVLADLRQTPGVEAASATSSLPLADSNVGTAVRVEGITLPEALRPSAGWQVVRPGYFATLGLPLLAGRDFTDEDLTRGVHHTVISEALARELFGNGDAVGRRVAFGPDAATPDWHVVVGVVGDVRHVDLAAPPDPRAYDLLGEHAETMMFVVSRGPMDASLAAQAIRAAVHRYDAAAPVFEVTTLNRLVADQTSPRWIAATIGAGVASVTLVLAGIGVYGLLAGAVIARTREIGIRRALGCSEGALLGLLLREGAWLVGAGAITGVALARVSARWLQSQLYGVEATDPRAFAVAVAFLISIGLAAAFVPARRAARIDPAITLRTE
jgi:putative ABC transport system permease protein